MHRGIVSRAWVSALTAMFLAVSLWLPAAQAGMVGTPAVAGAEQADVTRDEVLRVLQRDEVRAQLTAWGVEPANVEARVHDLTAAELETLADRMDEAPAGAGAGSVVGAALIVFLVLLITDILGYTSVFPFVERTAR